MLWECDGCGNTVEDDPHAHSDWGGVIKVYGPRCQECDQPMDPSPDQESEIVPEAFRIPPVLRRTALMELHELDSEGKPRKRVEPRTGPGGGTRALG